MLRRAMPALEVGGHRQERTRAWVRTTHSTRGLVRSCSVSLHRILILLTLACGLGCYRVPGGKTAVSDVTIKGTHDIDDEELEGRIATRESSRFLGLFEGAVYEYEIFDEYALRRDISRIERYLRARGYYQARVYAARVETKNNRVYVTIEVDQGEPVLVDSVGFPETAPVAEKTRREIRIGVARVLPLGAPFDEDKFEEAEKAARKGLTTSGHAAATVTREAEVDLITRRARLRFTVDPGPAGTFGEVTFEGLGELPVTQIRRVFNVVRGRRYSSEAIEDGRQALLDLGVFASVEVDQDLEEFKRSNVVPIRVKAQPSKVRAVLLGAGIELDSLKTDGHVQIGWQNGNFLGGLRKLDTRYKPGAILYPTRFPNLNPPTDILYEHRISASLSQPGFIEPRTTGFFRSEYNVYPVILPTLEGTARASENVLGYHELRGELGVERKFFRWLFVSPEYDIQTNFPFDYLGHVAGVDNLLISYVGLLTKLDFRDNATKPRRGIFIGNELQLAGGSVLQGDANDVRVNPEVRVHVPLPRRASIALRGAVGFLFPFNYSKYSTINFENPGPSRIDASRDYQLLFFRGFFGGGPSSNRGYPLRGIGPHDLIPYLSPAAQSSTAGCNPSDRDCLLPTGGLSQWEATVETRFVVSGRVSMAIFCDAGDVSPFQTSIRLDHPHLSCGSGARYDTGVVPIRLDVGYRIPGLQFPEGSPFEQEPTPLFDVLPVAVAFGIGEAF